VEALSVGPVDEGEGRKLQLLNAFHGPFRAGPQSVLLDNAGQK